MDQPPEPDQPTAQSIDATTDPRVASASFHRALEELSVERRAEEVAAARAITAWPSHEYLAKHAKKWGRGRNAAQYAMWTQNIKSRPGAEVYAFVHPVHRSRSIAFVDHPEGVVVNVDMDAMENRDTYSPARPTRMWVADQLDRGIFKRLRDTEL